MSATNAEIHLYWATGCTSCLRAKEFLERNDVPFVSHNVMEDESAFDDLTDMGLPKVVPVVTRGEEWANAQMLEEVAAVANIEHDIELLPVEELHARLHVFLDAAHRFLAQLPEDELETDIPNRPRSYADLVYHIFGISDSFVEHESGIRLDTYKSKPDWDHLSKIALSTYGNVTQRRLHDWFEGPGQTCDWSERSNVYFGSPSKHEFFERTTWHTGQHTRQLQWVLEEELGLEVDEPLDPETWDGLPMPEKVWDNAP